MINSRKTFNTNALEAGVKVTYTDLLLYYTLVHIKYSKKDILKIFKI
jgi:hypothetical protein